MLGAVCVFDAKAILDASGMQVGCKWDASGMQVGCKKWGRFLHLHLQKLKTSGLSAC
ncbi:hypothetical protein DSBG_3043 [Desulfosporosinus sp. BG]|nr:hypothetical protein DSBG_3043 [Desulfosporosinus sp. BG]